MFFSQEGKSFAALGLGILLEEPFERGFINSLAKSKSEAIYLGETYLHTFIGCFCLLGFSHLWSRFSAFRLSDIALCPYFESVRHHLPVSSDQERRKAERRDCCSTTFAETPRHLALFLYAGFLGTGLLGFCMHPQYCFVWS